jgi:hypothetical protein
MKRLSICLATFALVSCGGGGGGGSAPVAPPVAVSCTAPQFLLNGVCATPVGSAPTVTLAFDNVSMVLGGTATLTWSSTDATSCTASGAWNGIQQTGGTAPQKPASTGTLTYALSCMGNGGIASKSIDLTVANHPNSFSSRIVNSIMPVPIVMPIQSPLAGATVLDPNGYYSRYTNMGANATAQGDMRGTGLDDIIVTPNSSPAFLPNSKMEFWVNNGDGTFTNKADQLIVGGAPTLALGPTNVIDFNGDGILDILHMDSPEWGSCTAGNPALCTSGGKFTYLQGQANGTWIDKSNQLPPTINTDSAVSIGSSNGDGIMDFIFSANGLHLYKNDGKGNFVDDSNRLPLEIRGFTDWQTQWNATGGLSQSSFGAATFAKVTGHSKPILVTGSYGYDLGTQPGGPNAPGVGSAGTSSIRFFTQQSDGTFTNAQTIIITQYDTTDSNVPCPVGLIIAGDVTKSGTDDILVIPDTSNLGCNPILLRNSGTNGVVNYVDVTAAAIPQYQSAFHTIFKYGVGSIANEMPNLVKFVDADGDGNLDIALGVMFTGSETLLQRVPYIYGDGKGNFAVKSIELDNKVPLASEIDTAVGNPPFPTWGGFGIPLRLKPNRYGILIITEGWEGDFVLNTTLHVSQQIRLHAILPSQ